MQGDSPTRVLVPVQGDSLERVPAPVQGDSLDRVPAPVLADSLDRGLAPVQGGSLNRVPAPVQGDSLERVLAPMRGDTLDPAAAGPGSGGSDSLSVAAAPADSARAAASSSRRSRADWRSARWRSSDEAVAPAIEFRAAPFQDRSLDFHLRTLLEHELRLRRMPAGAYTTPDPIGPGDLPGREPVSFFVQGVSTTPAAFPGTTLDPVGPLWIERVSLRHFDPTVLPSDPAAGPAVDFTLAEPESAGAASAARLSGGSNRSFTNEFILARPAGASLIRFFYSDRKSEFRDVYDREFGENLGARFDHGATWGGWWADWHKDWLRVRRGDTRFLWFRSSFGVGAVRRTGFWQAVVSNSWSWDRRRFEGGDGGERRDGLGRLFLQLRGRQRLFQPVLTVQWDAQRLRWNSGESSRNLFHHGLGFAGGFKGASESWRYGLSAGRSAPAPKKSGWTAAADLERDLGRAWDLRLHLDRAIRPLLLPALSGDYAVLARQGLDPAGAEDDRPLEELRRASLRLGTARDARSELALHLRAIQLDHTVSAEGGMLPFFTAAAYNSLPASAYDRTVRAVSASLLGSAPLGRGFALRAEALARRSNPGWRDQIWMAPWEGSTLLTWRGQLFHGDLDLELFLRGTMSGRRATPYGVVSASDRWDGGGAGTIGRLTLSFAVINIEDDLQEAAGYDDTLTRPRLITLPLNSYRTGLTWRFAD